MQKKKSGEIMKRVIICDEEIESVSKLSTMIGQIFPKQFLLHGYVSAKQLFYEIEDGFIRTADIIFLSMEIKWVTEIDFAVYIQQKFPMAQIIFLAENLQQVEAMFDEISPDGLLLKPLNRQRLEKCVKKVLSEKGGKEELFSIKQNGTAIFFPIEEISYVESQGRKLQIHRKDAVICIYGRISGLCEAYGETFIRCHQSYAVNRNHIVELAATKIILENGMEIPVSRQRYREVKAALEHNHAYL